MIAMQKIKTRALILDIIFIIQFSFASARDPPPYKMPTRRGTRRGDI
jgi:hypothetical protein